MTLPSDIKIRLLSSLILISVLIFSLIKGETYLKVFLIIVSLFMFFEWMRLISKNFWIFRLFSWGTILFSFSIFLLSLQKIFSINLSFLGPITPVGEALLILGWTIIIYRILKK